MTIVNKGKAESLINIALHKPATQSSLSEWSTENDAGGALVASPSNFGFHTAEEETPWWMVDLEQIYPIENIVIYNRIDGYQDKARTLTIESSVDGIEWLLLHSGLSYFGSNDTTTPFNLPLEGNVWGRFIRLSLKEKNYFHLSRVQVFVDAAAIRAVEIRTQLGLSYPLMGEPRAGGVPEYRVLAASGFDLNGPLIGLQINENGAFGNSVVQYANAIEIAKFFNLKYVKVAPKKLIKLDSDLIIDEIHFLTAESHLAAGGCFLEGSFFNRNYFDIATGQANNQAYHDIIKKYVMPLYSYFTPAAMAPKPKDELAIHIRSGDIFSTWVHPVYVQPPLSFYKLAVCTLLDGGEITRVKLVFEDRLNPVVDALEQWLIERDIPYTCQSGSVVDDICALINAHHLVFGFGTFGIGICQFSNEIQNVFYFSPDRRNPYKGIPNIKKTYHVCDANDMYIKIGEWNNSIVQRQQMIDYPASNIEIIP